MKSWRTTLAGILMVVGTIAMQLYYLLDGDPSTKFNLDAVLSVLGGLGLLFARDHVVTSEEAVPEKVAKANGSEGK